MTEVSDVAVSPLPAVLPRLEVALAQQLDEVGGVGQVAVVAEGDRAGRRGPERRLGVVPDAGAGRGVAGVPDRDLALERLERGLVEHLGDESHVLVDEDLAAVADRDSGRFLPTVLQGVEAEVGQLGDLFTGRPDSEDATGVLGSASWGSRSWVRRPSPRGTLQV